MSNITAFVCQRTLQWKYEYLLSEMTSAIVESYCTLAGGCHSNNQGRVTNSMCKTANNGGKLHNKSVQELWKNILISQLAWNIPTLNSKKIAFLFTCSHLFWWFCWQFLTSPHMSTCKSAQSSSEHWQLQMVAGGTMFAKCEYTEFM